MCDHAVKAYVRGRLLFWRHYSICALCSHRERCATVGHGHGSYA